MLEQLEHGLGLSIIIWFQSWGQGFVWKLLTPMHYLGEETGYLLFLPVLYWSVHKKNGIRLIVAVMMSALLTIVFKLLWMRPRPFQVAPDLVHPIYQTTSNGIPSGHTVFATVFGLTVSRLVKRWWVPLLAAVFIVLTAMSRMIHGVHYPQDVLAGFILGLVFLLVFNYLYDKHAPRVAAWPLRQQLFSVVMIMIVVFVAVILGYEAHESRKHVLSILAALSGGAIGLSLESRLVQFSEAGRLLKRSVRAVLGLMALVLVYAGLMFLYYAVVGEHKGVWVLMLYVLRYGLVGLWITLGAPWLFVTCRLSEKMK